MNIHTITSKFVLSFAALCIFSVACTQNPEDTSNDPLPEASETADEGGELLDIRNGKADGQEVKAYGPIPEGLSWDTPLIAAFAPDDPVATIELDHIERIIQARAQNPDTFEEGSNPYQIRYAVYNLRNPQIVDALLRAEKNGVDVQILIESAQLNPKKTWNTADEALIEGGFEFAPDHRRLSAQEQRTADLIGIVDSGLTHLKTRIFQTPEATTVITGSMNPGDNAVLNEETFHIIRDPSTVASYLKAYDSLLNDLPFENSFDPEAPINVMFTPAAPGSPRASTQLLQWIEEEQEQILLMVFSLREISAPGVDESLVTLLSRKAQEGIPVVLITDRKQSDGVDAEGNRLYRDDWTEDRLRRAGVIVYEATNRATPYTAMHHKVGIFGRSRIRIVSDAANWSQAAFGTPSKVSKNTESVLFIDSSKLDDNHTGRRYIAQWLRVLSRYGDQTTQLDEAPPWEDVAKSLQSADDWPKTPVLFRARVETSWGERAAIRGEGDALGRWGDMHDGHLLVTDDDLYPDWVSGEPALLPLGVSTAWKTVILADDGAVYWENRANRIVRPQPSLGVPVFEMISAWE